MSENICNKVEKLNPPPYVTTLISSEPTRRVIYNTWSKLTKHKNKLAQKTRILQNEVELLKGFIERKGTQLRLEKALLLTNRIYKLGTRWVSNKFLHEFLLFNEGVELSVPCTIRKKRTKDDEGEIEERTTEADGNDGIRLPSRQWANWIIYLTLRDTLILAKIKFECERTVKFWLGLISSSHHATDSLVVVGILSRIWYESSTIVEDFITVMYPTFSKLSIHLESTKAENWLKDFENPEDLSSWLQIVLGFPFIPARLSRGMEELGKSGSKKAKMDTVLGQVFKPDSNVESVDLIKEVKPEIQRPSTSAAASRNQSDDEEDLGVPVVVPSKKSKKKNKKLEGSQSVTLNKRWTRFFTDYKEKLKIKSGRKQFVVRIRKYLEDETDAKKIVRLKKFRKCIQTNNYEKMMEIAINFQKFLAKNE